MPRSAPAAGLMAAKTRYRQVDAACELRGATTTDCELAFAEPQWAVTPGQSAVLYQGDVCLGGGVIAASNVPNTLPTGSSRSTPELLVK